MTYFSFPCEFYHFPLFILSSCNEVTVSLFTVVTGGGWSLQGAVWYLAVVTGVTGGGWSLQGVVYFLLCEVDSVISGRSSEMVIVLI